MKRPRAPHWSTGAPLGMDALQTAAGIIRIVNTHMAVDIRLALQEQGQDPRSFALIAFGGAGPLHAATLARSVGISTVLVPRYPGLNCALGMLQTSVRHSYLRSEIGSLARIAVDRVNELFAALEAHAMQEAKEEGFAPGQVKLTRLLDLRYPHQGYSLCVPCPAPFDEAARRGQARVRCAASEVYGQSAPNENPEIVTFRLQSEIAVPRLVLPELDRTRRQHRSRDQGTAAALRYGAAGVRPRQCLGSRETLAGDRFEGPAVIEQFDSTTVVLAGQTVSVDTSGTLVIEERERPA